MYNNYQINYKETKCIKVAVETRAVEGWLRTL